MHTLRHSYNSILLFPMHTYTHHFRVTGVKSETMHTNTTDSQDRQLTGGRECKHKNTRGRHTGTITSLTLSVTRTISYYYSPHTPTHITSESPVSGVRQYTQTLQNHRTDSWQAGEIVNTTTLVAGTLAQ